MAAPVVRQRLALLRRQWMYIADLPYRRRRRNGAQSPTLTPEYNYVTPAVKAAAQQSASRDAIQRQMLTCHAKRPYSRLAGVGRAPVERIAILFE